VLHLNLAEESALKEFSTLSGFLCMCAGEIPATGDLIMSRGWCFEVEHADDKRILLVRVDRLIGEEKEGEDDEKNNSIMKAIKRLNKNEESSDDDEGEEDMKTRDESTIEENIKKSREAKLAEAKQIERIADGGRKKMQMLNEVSKVKRDP
jgi:Transporter associated domain